MGPFVIWPTFFTQVSEEVIEKEIKEDILWINFTIERLQSAEAILGVQRRRFCRIVLRS